MLHPFVLFPGALAFTCFHNCFFDCHFTFVAKKIHQKHRHSHMHICMYVCRSYPRQWQEKEKNCACNAILRPTIIRSVVRGTWENWRYNFFWRRCCCLFVICAQIFVKLHKVNMFYSTPYLNTHVYICLLQLTAA